MIETRYWETPTNEQDAEREFNAYREAMKRGYHALAYACITTYVQAYNVAKTSLKEDSEGEKD